MEELKKLLTSDNDSDCTIIIGKKHSGKSTLLIEILDKTDKKQIIYISPKVNTFKKISINILIVDPANFLKNIIHRDLENTLILFDDCKQYISANPNEKNASKIRDFLISSRHKNNTIRFAYHTLEQVNNDFVGLCDSLIFFKMNSNIDRFIKENYLNENVKTCFDSVNSNKSDHYNKEIEI